MNEPIFLKKFLSLPESLKKEAEDFIDFLLLKKKPSIDKKENKKPKFGSAKGSFKMSADFDKPLEDFKEYM